MSKIPEQSEVPNMNNFELAQFGAEYLNQKLPMGEYNIVKTCLFSLFEGPDTGLHYV